MATDLLAEAVWACCATTAGAAETPDELDALGVEWVPAPVPGTVAGALVAAGRSVAGLETDTSDWWYCCRLPSGGEGRWTLTFEGLATVADAWFRGAHVLHAENMFVARSVELEAVAGDDELVLRFGALAPLLAARRPRPRWKTHMADHQGLRWFRTTLLGRQPGWAETPAPVGPWRPVRLEPAGPRLRRRRVAAVCVDADGGTEGVVSVSVRVAGLDAVPGAGHPGSARLRVAAPGVPGPEGEVAGPLSARAEGDEVVVEGELVVPGVARWWPHTHGAQPLYALDLEVGGRRLALGRVGFRTVRVDRAGGAFTVVVNGEAVFCRGACWWPVDPLNLHAGDDELRGTLALVREGHMNMVRIPGGTVYEDERFWDLCDELGVLVWQDCMLGYVDPPEDEAFESAVVAELEEVFGRLGGRPSLAVVCGGQEIEEQAAMFGLPPSRWGCPLIEKTIPALAERLLPEVPYVTSSPTGGDLPFQPDRGDCHYWGVGSYLRPPEDARRSGIRFMSEGMGFAVPPERATVEEACGGAMGAGHDPGWKRALHHDTGRSWDLEDVRDFYVGELLGVDPQLLRYLDPERALDLGRAVVAELYGRTLTEWRRPGSTCAGGLSVALRDLVPGAGWGLIDALGRPKAPWYALRRVLAPVALLVSDEGLNGLHLHLVNDTAAAVGGEVTVTLFARGELPVEQARRPVEIPARGHVVVESGSLFEGFRDVSYSYRFGPPAYDVVAAALTDAAGALLSEAVHLPTGLARATEPDVGLEAVARRAGGRGWSLSVSTRRFAQWVVVEVPGYRVSDSWFHLPPGATRTVTLEGGDPDGRPAGQVRALNGERAARVVVAEG